MKFKPPWGDAGLSNHLDDKVDLDLEVVNKGISIPTCGFEDVFVFHPRVSVWGCVTPSGQEASPLLTLIL